MTETSTDHLLSIGAFARLTRLSLKALRLYDDLGLLAPARVDPASGYRSYHPAQVQRAERIALLRRLDLPLADIRDLLELQGRAAALRLRLLWAQRERLHREQAALMPHIERLLTGETMTEYAIQERLMPAQQLATIERRVQVPDLVPFTMEAVGRLYDALAGQSLTPGPEHYVIFHGRVDHENDGPVEVAVPFEGGALRTSGDIRAREEPARRELYATTSLAQTRFPDILEAYDAVAAAIRERHLTCPLSPREVYWRPPQGLAPDDPFCHIAYPITDLPEAHHD